MIVTIIVLPTRDTLRHSSSFFSNRKTGSSQVSSKAIRLAESFRPFTTGECFRRSARDGMFSTKRGRNTRVRSSVRSKGFLIKLGNKNTGNFIARVFTATLAAKRSTRVLHTRVACFVPIKPVTSLETAKVLGCPEKVQILNL